MAGPLTREDIFQAVKKVLVEKLGIDESQVTEEVSLREDLKADSLDLTELVMELEDQFGMRIPDEDARKLETVGQAVDYILEH